MRSCLSAIFLDLRSSSASEISQSQQLEGPKAASAILKKKKKKKSHSLVRKLSLNKFRLSPEQQETRHTPEGGDSSRSQSQSPQESPVHPNEPIKNQGQGDNVPEGEKGAKRELKKPEKLLEKPPKTVAVVQHTTPLLVKSFVQQGEPCRMPWGLRIKFAN